VDRRVIASEEATEGVTKEGSGLEAGVDLLIELERMWIEEDGEDREVDVACFEAVRESLGHRDDGEVDLRRLLAEALQEGGQNQRVEEVGRDDAEGAARVLGLEGPRLGERAREADQATAEWNGKRFGARGEQHAAAASNQERVVEELAKATERVAHRRLSDAGALGGLGDAAFANEGVEGEQEIQIDPMEVLHDMSTTHGSVKTSHWIHVNPGLRVLSIKEALMEKAQKVLVVGATGGTGRATIDALLARGHRVTAFSRHAESLEPSSDRLTLLNGDATRPEDVDRAVAGHDAVVITLGITENPIRVRLFGTAKTPLDVRSAGTRNVIAAMQKHGVRRLVVQSSYGVGETRGSLRWLDRLFFGLLLKPQIADTEVQELEVRESEVDWVLAQPVHLTDEDSDAMPFASVEGEVREWKISRKGVAQFLASAVLGAEYVGRSVALSEAAAA